MRPFHTKVVFGMALALAVLAIGLSACKKTPDTIGNNLISESSIIGVGRTDTALISSHVYLDTIGSKNVRYGLLGSMNDPVFGPTEAGFYTQFRFSTVGQNFGVAPVVDSIVLQLNLSGVYGDTTALQTISVYELADTLSATESYYSHSAVETSNIDLANGYQFTPYLSNHMQVIGNDTVTQPIIRIPLDNSLGVFLAQLDSTVYQQPETFKSRFKGLFVKATATSQDGAVCYINLTNNTLTRLHLYYHDAATPEKPMRYDYYITSVENYFNHFDHDYSQGSSQLVQQVMQGETGLGQSQVYVQGMGGIRTRVTFPNLSQWADAFEGQHVVINDAKLIIPAAPGYQDSIFKNPSKLVLVGFKEDGSTYILPDNYEGESYFGGKYDNTTQTVTFRISEYIERVILGKEPNYGLSIGIDGAAYNASRWVINGPEAAQGGKMRLDITYSIVNE